MVKSKQDLSRCSESQEARTWKPAGMIWPLVGGATLVALAALLIVNIPDIKRYIRISTM